ncbi:MAG: ABC transporter permease [Reichenbachiella sp.]
MLKNYIKIAIRNIQNNAVYSFINIFGLTLGIVSSVIIYLFIQHERSYDQFHTKSEQIYRVATHAVLGETEFHGPTTMAPLGPAIYNDYPEVLNFVRINAGSGGRLFSFGNKKFFEDKIYYVDSSYFNMFDFELLKGNRGTCLQAPFSLVISESLAEKYFEGDDVLGKTIKVGGDEKPYMVTGVMADPMETSHLKPNALRSFSSMEGSDVHSWGSINDYTYILLPEDLDYKIFEKNFPEVYQKYVHELFSEFNATAEFYLQPLPGIHLDSHLEGEIEPPGSKAYLLTFGAIAFFLIIIACINYMNLATAKSASRSKEVGIRKAIGSYRRQLIVQFITESIVIAFIALIISAIVIFFLIPFFNDFAQITIPQNFMLQPEIFGVLFIIVVLVGLVGGSYPAFFLSGFKTVEVIKGKVINQVGAERLRKILVVSQFSISMIMVICTWIVFDQLSFLKTKDLGFNKDQVIVVPLNGNDARNKYEVLASELKSIPEVASVGSGNGIPGMDNHSMNGIKVETVDGDFIEAVFLEIRIDDQFLQTLEIPILEGRNFKYRNEKDSTRSVIVNEELVKYMNWRNPIGKRFQVFINDELETKLIKVVGVVKDFHVRSLQDPITPIVIHNNFKNGNMVIRLQGKNIEHTIEEVEKVFNEVIQNRPFSYTFLDQNFKKKYAVDQKRGEVFALFSFLTVAIACLGLFGLAAFTAQSRRKEIGIRKVVGAHVSNIILMMSKDLLKLVFISTFIAFPIAFYFMDRWLDGFAFRIEMTWSSYIYSALLIMGVAFSSILYQSVKSALANPVWSLREN